MRQGMAGTEPTGVASTGHRPATMVAVEVVLLWPHGVGERQAIVGEAGLWPVFVLVVDERRDQLSSSAGPLFELLDAPKGRDEITVVGGRTRWAVVDPRHALLRLTVTADGPVRFEADVLVPAERVLGVLDVVARGATIGITTRRHAAGLRDRVDLRNALRHLVLLGCPPSPRLAELTQELWAVGV
jgi:hypothetical protein